MKKTMLFTLVFATTLSLAAQQTTTEATVNAATTAEKKQQTKKSKTAKALKKTSQIAPALAPTSQTVASPAPTTSLASISPIPSDSQQGTALNTSTTSATPAKPSATVSGIFNVTAEAITADLKDKNTKAPADISGTAQVFYKVSEPIKVGLGYNFSAKVVSDRSQLADFNGDNGPDSAYKTLDPTIHFNYKLSTGFLGSNPYVIGSRYYVPTSEDTKKTKSMGTLRTQTYMTWTINPKFDFNFLTQLRLTLNTADNSKTTIGSDDVLRVIAGPSVSYNYNDNVSVYYGPTLDMKSTGWIRGNYSADVANSLSHEVGLWLTMLDGKFIINPLWATTGDAFGKSNYEGLGADANSVYDLNLIAYF